MMQMFGYLGIALKWKDKNSKGGGPSLVWNMTMDHLTC